jgi:HSP20 family protein
MAVVRWDPYRELTALQNEVNRLFGRSGLGEGTERQSWMPSVDVIETQDAIKFNVELAGMRPDDIKLEVDENVLTISGERRFEEELQEDKYYRIERRYGSFSRSIALPQNVNSEHIEASYTDGVLEVSVPKVEEAKPKRIEVKVAEGGPKTVEGTVAEKGAAE